MPDFSTVTTEKAILCVNDEPMVLWSLREQIVRHFGDRYLYEIAESAEEAWEVIEELRDEGIVILVVISDWLMPGMRGDEFLVRVHQRFPKIITVMLTGQADKAAIERTYRDANLHAYITKPWNETALISTDRIGFGKTRAITLLVCQLSIVN